MNIKKKVPINFYSARDEDIFLTQSPQPHLLLQMFVNYITILSFSDDCICTVQCWIHFVMLWAPEKIPIHYGLNENGFISCSVTPEGFSPGQVHSGFGGTEK